MPRRTRAFIPGLVAVIALPLALGFPADDPRVSAQEKIAREEISALWEEPADLEQRDLFIGAGGQIAAPSGTLAFVSRDTTGASPGFDVKDANGLTWSVKLGPEAQSEVTSSRILWAIGFHQRPSYYVAQWTMSGEVSGAQPAGRFRPELPGEKVIGDWSWRENPFLGSRPYGGLIVANLILNSWDWKTSNNKIYEITATGGVTRRLYIVRDLGASLGRTSQPPVLSALGVRNSQGTKNDLEGFEAQGFVQVDGDGDIDFDYHGMYDEIVARAGKEDLRWACALLARLSDKQLADAFRAGGYTDEQTKRYVTKLKAKIAQGVAAAK